jgi:hypothetical protein
MAKSNWTEQESTLAVDTYNPDNSETSLAEVEAQLPGKTRRQIIAKLTHAKVYKAPPKPERKTPVDDGPTVKEIMDEIRSMGFDPENFANTRKAGLIQLRDLVKQIQG